jgi:hypothetical protein
LKKSGKSTSGLIARRESMRRSSSPKVLWKVYALLFREKKIASVSAFFPQETRAGNAARKQRCVQHYCRMDAGAITVIAGRSDRDS